MCHFLFYIPLYFFLISSVLLVRWRGGFLMDLSRSHFLVQVPTWPVMLEQVRAQLEARLAASERAGGEADADADADAKILASREGELGPLESAVACAWTTGAEDWRGQTSARVRVLARASSRCLEAWAGGTVAESLWTPRVRAGVGRCNGLHARAAAAPRHRGRTARRTQRNAHTAHTLSAHGASACTRIISTFPQ